MRQAEWVTRMARMAATELRCRLGDQRGRGRVLVAARRDAQGCARRSSRSATASFAGAGGTSSRARTSDAFFAERMTVRLCDPAFPGDKRTIYHAHQKVAHRADPDVVVEAGNHNAFGVGLEPLRGWHPIEVLHFSLRSVAQLARKARGGWVRNPDEPVVEHQARLDDALRTRPVPASCSTTYAVTTRSSRRAWPTERSPSTRACATPCTRCATTGRSVPAAGRRAVRSPSRAPDVADAAAYAAEASVLVEIDGIRARRAARRGARERASRALRTLPRR